MKQAKYKPIWMSRIPIFKYTAKANSFEKDEKADYLLRPSADFREVLIIGTNTSCDGNGTFPAALG